GGLPDDITAALSGFSYLRVVSRDHVSGHVGEGTAAGRQLGARYLLEGSVRTSGPSVRVSGRVVDVVTGSHLWAENFDRDLNSAPFAVQDEVSGRIAARVADPSGVLVRAMAASLKGAPGAPLTVF